MSAPEIARLLRAIADVIDASTSSDISTLTREVSQLAPDTLRMPVIADKAQSSRVDIKELANRLLSSSNRDEAKAMLVEARLTRKELSAFSRSHNIHVVKEDNVETIEGKIVESFVGSRLNSKAIRGEG